MSAHDSQNTLDLLGHGFFFLNGCQINKHLECFLEMRFFVQKVLDSCARAMDSGPLGIRRPEVAARQNPDVHQGLVQHRLVRELVLAGDGASDPGALTGVLYR